MNDNKRRAIVWDTIERLAFRPKKPATWLSTYKKTLHPFWGKEKTYIRFGTDSEFIIPFFLNLKCCFFIESESKYNISFVHDSSDCPRGGQFHVDSGFFSKASLQAFVEKYPQEQMKKKLSRDVEAVLNGMLFHPRCHAHLDYLGVPHVQLDQDSGGLSSHEVRIGGGIENPYVFLFHLRYQFCLVHEHVRHEEKLRLIDLFEGAIQRKEQRVIPEKLFNS
jgi:hypothetical protein